MESAKIHFVSLYTIVMNSSLFYFIWIWGFRWYNSLQNSSIELYLRVIQGEQTKLRAICYNYQSRNVSRCWANEIRKGLEKIGMGWVWAKGRENHKNVWRKVRRRFMDINQQEIMKFCKEIKSLSLQKEIKQRWGKEPYLHVLGLQERSGLAWTRLGAWRALKFTDDSWVRVCPMCGNFEYVCILEVLGRVNISGHWRP